MNNLIPNQFADNFFGSTFKTPWDLLIFYDEDFRDERIQLYPWQREILETFSVDVPAEDMIRMAVVANNGSGKSQYVLAPCAIWVAVAFKRSLSYVTSASASQLDTQTERFIDYLAGKMNTLHRKEFAATEDVWRIVKRSKQFLPNDSSIDLFATDEPKKAEGKHPLPGGREFAIFVDEGKSIEESIYGAIDRCTGATRRLDISSAGGCFGHFYDICTKGELGWWHRKIKYTDTPHVKNKELEQAILKYGINDPLVRSIYFSEFTSVDDSTVVTRETWDKCKKFFDDSRIVSVGDNLNRMGVDLSGGGDESVCSIWRSNVQIAVEAFRFYDTAQGAKEVMSIQDKYGIKDGNVNIEFDGFNRGIVDSLADKGRNYNKVLAAGKAFDSNRYSNRMTELWFELKRYIEEGYILFLDDITQKNQFIGRYYKRSLLNSKIQLESKKEARAKGHPSPDRADASVLAWANMPLIDEFFDKHVGASERDRIAAQAPKYGRRVAESEVTQYLDDLAYGDQSFFTGKAGLRERPITANSLASIDKFLKQNNGNNEAEFRR